MQQKKKNLVRGMFSAAMASAALLGSTLFSSTAMAANPHFAINPDITVLYMVSDINQGGLDTYPVIPCPEGTDASICTPAAPGATPDMSNFVIAWHYSGNVYAALANPATGVQQPPIQQIGTVEGYPMFPTNMADLMMSGTEPTVPWTCNDCTLVVSGTTFHKIPTMPLDGRMFTGLGMVTTQPTDNVLMAFRMAGCAGVQANDQGPYANMHGTLCLNGTLGIKNFNPDPQNMVFDGVGASNCVLVLQH